jgi:signal peptidase I
MNLRWFLSRTVRHASHMRKHVWKILNAQRDLLSPQAIQAVSAALDTLKAAVATNVPNKALLEQMESLEKVANKWLKPYPSASLRENVEVLLVAIAVAMGIRTFFLQPFKIPTGSMQPTLYGITHENLIGHDDVKFPNPVAGFLLFWTRGVSYKHIQAKADGRFDVVDELPKRFLLFNISQRFRIGGEVHTVWFPPENLWKRAGLTDGYGNVARREFKRGEDVIKLRAVSGDHLFVDRLTYNFRRPKRGEIIVLKTEGIHHPQVPQDQFYIKRLVAMGGERVRIGDDQHLIIDGKRLDARTPHFELVYSFKPEARDNEYFGHIQVRDGLFRNENQEYQVRSNHYLVMGDNTRNSLDSRYFGDFAREYVIGKSFFVYWPFTSRFGLGYR